jgi:hypothetical protein
MSVTLGSTYSQKANPYTQTRMSGSRDKYLTETYLGSTSLPGAFLNEIETLELPETLEQLHNLFISQIRGQATDVDLVGRVLNSGGNDTGDMNPAAHALGADVVLGSSDLEGDALEDDAVECHSSGRFFRGSELMAGRGSATYF